MEMDDAACTPREAHHDIVSGKSNEHPTASHGASRQDLDMPYPQTVDTALLNLLRLRLGLTQCCALMAEKRRERSW
jgi:hypothetical protein